MIAQGALSELGERCSDVSRTAGESLSATATTVERWLLVEVAGSWPRDVSLPGPLPEEAHEWVAAWLARTPRARVLFLRRPGRAADRPRVFAVWSEETRLEIRRIEIECHEDLASMDFDAAGERFERPLVLVCGHGSRDRCCALKGTPVFGALERELGEVELWISSHQGGHRFAGNVLVLPSGLQLGRLGPEQAALVTKHAVAGTIELGYYRGRTCYEPPVQAAEHAIRESTGLRGVDDLRLGGVEDAIVRFRAGTGDEYAAVVEEIAEPVVQASCGAPPEAQKAYRAHVI